MRHHDILNDPDAKAKEKVAQLVNLILEQSTDIEALTELAKGDKKHRGNIVECIAQATSKRPELADEGTVHFLIECLEDKQPRVVWEASKAIANVIDQHLSVIELALHPLLKNTEHKGTVVRWATAQALCAIAATNTPHAEELLKAIEAIHRREENNGVKKIYGACLKPSRS